MYLAVDTPSLTPFQSSRPEADKASSIKDLRVLCSFERALQRLNQEVPAETYRKLLGAETRVVAIEGNTYTHSPVTVALRDGAVQLSVLLASML